MTSAADDIFASEEDLEEYLTFHFGKLAFLVGEQLTFDTESRSAILAHEKLISAIRAESRTPRELERLEHKMREAIRPVDGAFQHIIQTRGLDHANELIRRLILQFRLSGEARTTTIADVEALRMLQNEPRGWKVPPALEDLGRILASSPAGTAALTTCLDPLLYVSTRRANSNPTLFALQGDGGFNGIDAPEGCLIIHIHGHWLLSDGLYTPSQRQQDRPKLAASISSILAQRILLIVGIDPTENAVLAAIAQAADGGVIPLKVAWALSEPPDVAKVKYAPLLQLLRSGIQRGRVVVYAGVNYDAVFRRIAESRSAAGLAVSLRTSDPVTELVDAALRTARDAPQHAVDTLNDCMRRLEGRLALHDSIRLLSEMASAYEHTGDRVAAIETYERVSRISTDTLDAQAFQALADLHSNDYESVRALCENILSVNPEHELALTAYIHAAAPSTPTTQLLARTPERIQTRPNVMYALGWHAFRSGELELAESLANKGLENESRGSRFAELKASAVLKKYETEQARCAPVSPTDLARLVEIESLLTSTLTRRLDKLSRSRAIYLRAETLWRLERHAECEHNFRTLLEPGEPIDVDYLDRFLEYLLGRQRAEDADTVVRQQMKAIKAALPHPVVLRLCEVAERRGWISEALTELVESVKSCIIHAADEDTERLYLLRCIRWFIRLAPNLIPTDVQEMAKPLGRAMQLALYCLAAQRGGAPEASLDAAKAAREALERDGSVMASIYVAEALARTNSSEGRSLALPLIRPLISNSEMTPLLHQAFEVSLLCQDDRMTLEVARQMRERCLASPPTLEQELKVLLQFNAYEKALNVIEYGLSHCADDSAFAWYLTLRKSLIGIHLRRESIISTDIKYILGDEVHPKDLVRYIYIVIKHSDPARALTYLYYQTIKYRNDPDVCRAFADAVGPECAGIPALETVAVDVAVRLVLQGSRIKWVIVEPRTQWLSAPDTFAPEHPLVMGILGKRLGERCDVPYGQGTVDCIITAIISKYVHLRNQIWEEWELAHPGERYVEQFDIPRDESGNPNVQELLRILSEKNPGGEHLRQLTEHSMISPSVLARLSRRSVPEALRMIVATSRTPVRCCTRLDLAQASEHTFERDAYVVVDPVALVTLMDSGMVRCTEPISRRLVVTQGTLDEYRQMLLRHSEDPGREVTIVCHFRNTWNLSQIAEQLDWIESNWQVVDALECAVVESATLRELQNAFPAPTVEALLVARQFNCILWTDDYAVASYASGLLQLRRTWTQRVVSILPSGGLDQPVGGAMNRHLLRNAYELLEPEIDAILDLCVSEGWELESKCVIAAVRAIAAPPQIEKVVEYSLLFLYRACRALDSRPVRLALARSLIGNLRSRSDWLAVTTEVRQQLPIFFGLDVVNVELIVREL